MAGGAKFADLMPRIASALVLLGVSGVGLWLGGIALAVLLSVFGAVMFWEFFRLITHLSRATSQIYVAVSSVLLAISLVLGHVLDAPAGAFLSVSPIALVGIGAAMAVTAFPVRKSWLELLFGAMIPLATFLFFHLHQSVPNLMWIVVAVVISTDVAGYFFGKFLGGPKFWPSLSPNKTWSGTAAGWVMAAIIAICFGLYSSYPMWLMAMTVVFFVAVSFAAQLADIAESALKRRAGVKDSSNLLPGHGGALDRFDGMLGAFTVAGLAIMLLGVAVGSVVGP